METGQIHFNQPYLNFLISLADFTKVNRIFLLTGIIDISSLPVDVRDKVTLAPLDQYPKQAMANLKDFDLSIIVPNFGRINRQDLKFPTEWERSKTGTAFIEDAWLAWAISATRANGQILAVTSQGMLNSTLRQPIRQKIIDEGLNSVILLGATYRPETSVNSAALVIKRGAVASKLTLIDVSQVAEDADWIAIAKSIQKSKPIEKDVSGYWFVNVSSEQLTQHARLDPDFYHPRFLQIEPPSGYTEFLLSDIAEIRGGRSLSSLEKPNNDQDDVRIPFVQVSNITQAGQLSVEWARTYPQSLKHSSQSGWAKPGDILVTSAGTLGKVCIVPETYSEGVFFDTSIRRVCADHEVVSTDMLYDYLKSETAQLQMERYSSGSVIPIISTANLGSVRVFIPDSSDDDGKVVKIERKPERTHETFSKVIARILQEKVVTPLLAEDQNEISNWREDTIEKLRGIMRQIQKDHEPLEDVVSRHYPMPIALAYRRMTRAYHNPYEQMNRLVELYESIAQFLYYVLLSDYLRTAELYKNLPLDKAFKSSVKAFESFSMDRRLKFIHSLLERVKQEQIQIFVPELLSVDLFTPLNQLRQIRNESAHSAAGTPAAQKALFELNWPPIQDLLEQLRFLREYPLCRIENFYSTGNRTLFRAEFFQGALQETDIREQEAAVAEDGQLKLIGADREHVILLNPQFDWLDLHPFYQVITSPEYKYESHLCFHKQIRNKKLFGESIQFRTEFTLPGIDDLEQMKKSAGL